ncbi:MAG: hypothetical protein ACYDBT_17740 [Desulfobulbaceae bacterium]
MTGTTIAYTYHQSGPAAATDQSDCLLSYRYNFAVELAGITESILYPI